MVTLSPLNVLRQLTARVTSTARQEPIATAQARVLAADGFDALPPAPLRRGDSGRRVQELQQALVELDVLSRDAYRTGPGVYGPRTRRAVARFQQRVGLPVNGVFTEATRAAMARKLRAKTPDFDADRGTPLFDQDDPRWGRRHLGNKHHTIDSAGCALTATAMAISRISGRRIDPGELDRWCDRNGGYFGNDLIWDRAARARGLRAARPAFSLERIDANLAGGRPVVIGVNFKKGGGVNGTDHWLTVTARRRDEKGRRYYVCHDPGLGRQIRLYPHGTRYGFGLKSPPGASHDYTTTAQLRTFYRP